MLAIAVQEKEVRIVFTRSPLQTGFNRSSFAQTLRMPDHGCAGSRCRRAGTI
jgi:hypothetical protein